RPRKKASDPLLKGSEAFLGRFFVDLAVFFAGTLIPPLAAVMLLMFMLPAGAASRGVAGAFPLLARRELLDLRFYREGMGLDDPGASMMQMLKFLGLYLLLLVPMIGA